jgi:hypothetical protein
MLIGAVVSALFAFFAVKGSGQWAEQRATPDYRHAPCARPDYRPSAPLSHAVSRTSASRMITIVIMMHYLPATVAGG